MQIKNPLDLYKLLNKSNCRQCMLPSCMAFAVAVIQDSKRLGDCPHLDAGLIENLQQGVAPRSFLADDQEEIVRKLRGQVAELDFAEVADRTLAVETDGRLAINCLGKDFLIDHEGNMASSCHLIPWVQIPLLNYLLYCEGSEPRGEWVAMGELQGSAQWGHYFSHRCEEPFRQLAEAHLDLVFEILQVFNALPLEESSSADYSLVVRPLPLVPVLINFWNAEDDFPSQLNILFDRTADKNLPAEALYMMIRGIVEMFRQLILRHSRDGRLF